MTRILLRSSWQTVNIGDIAHTPGILALLEQHLPDVEVFLWYSKIDNGVEAMLRQRFPKLRFVHTEAEIEAAIESCDFFLHGSGAFLVGANQLEHWRTKTDKPYGIFGITLPAEHANERMITLLNGARFVYFRDSVSLQLAKERGVHSPIMEFGPDAAFAVDVYDEKKASAYLNANGLEDGKFLCCIGRYRITPYWRIPEKNLELDPVKEAYNTSLKEQDHAPLREAICKIVRETDYKVLLCPEDRTQMQIAKEMLWNQLPADVQARIVLREQYWLTDEALSTYCHSAGLFGLEMHSPIMCIAHGIPAIVVRWAEQTSKGYMWRDIGLDHWLYDFDLQTDRDRFPSEVLQWAQDLPLAREQSANAKQVVTKIHARAMNQLKIELKQPS